MEYITTPYDIEEDSRDLSNYFNNEVDNKEIKEQADDVLFDLANKVIELNELQDKIDSMIVDAKSDIEILRHLIDKFEEGEE